MTRVTPTQAERAARAAARIARRKRDVPAESAWAGVRDLVAALPGVGARVLERAHRAFVETYGEVMP